jgi:hypothetical protein
VAVYAMDHLFKGPPGQLFTMATLPHTSAVFGTALMIIQIIIGDSILVRVGEHTAIDSHYIPIDLSMLCHLG